MMNALNGQEHVVKKSKFTEEQITFALKQAELGTRVEEVCRKRGASARRLSTSGRSVTAVSVLLNCAACASWRKKTASSSRSWPI